MKKNKLIKCSICKKEIKDIPESHNAEPINNGRCCEDCNYKIVLPERLNQISSASN